MNKIAVLMNLKDEHVARIREAAPGYEVIAGKDPAVWESHLGHVEIVAGWNKRAESALLSPQSPLKWVQHWGAGVDHLPLEQLKNKGVILTNASGVHAYPISESILALMLAFTRNIHLYVRNQMIRKWDHSGLRLEMHGKTVGILGLGAIGCKTARLAKAFGMRVLGTRRHAKPTPHVDTVYTLERLNEMLPLCDYVVVTLPLTPKTYHLFQAEQFKQMKSSAFFINIGRGGTVDTEALVSALRSGEIAGAGLDVFEQEPLDPEHPLWAMDNVIITPHTSGSTQHYDERAMEIFMNNLQTYIKGEVPDLNVVNYDQAY